MTDFTHVLDLKIALDLTSLLQPENITGSMLALNVADSASVSGAYASNITNTIKDFLLSLSSNATIAEATIDVFEESVYEQAYQPVDERSEVHQEEELEQQEEQEDFDEDFIKDIVYGNEVEVEIDENGKIELNDLIESIDEDIFNIEARSGAPAILYIDNYSVVGKGIEDYTNLQVEPLHFLEGVEDIEDCKYVIEYKDVTGTTVYGKRKNKTEGAK